MPPSTQRIRALVALRELHSGDWQGYPINAPKQLSHEASRTEVLLDLEMSGAVVDGGLREARRQKAP